MKRISNFTRIFCVALSLGIPLAVGFSISRRAQVEALHPRAEIAVVGSHLIRVYESDGLDGVRKSIGELLGR